MRKNVFVKIISTLFVAFALTVRHAGRALPRVSLLRRLPWAGGFCLRRYDGLRLVALL